MTIPVWYVATEGGGPSVQGSTDQGLIKHLQPPEENLWQRLRLVPLLWQVWVFIGLVLGVFSVVRVTSVVAMPPPPLTDRVMLPTTYPSPPRLTLVAADAVEVESDPDCSTMLLVADAPTGEFRPYYEVPSNEHTVYLAPPHGKLWLHAYSSNSFGRSQVCNTLEVPMSGLRGER